MASTYRSHGKIHKKRSGKTKVSKGMSEGAQEAMSAVMGGLMGGRAGGAIVRGMKKAAAKKGRATSDAKVENMQRMKDVKSSAVKKKSRRSTAGY